MKRKTVNKLLAIAVSAALCVPILLTDTINVSATATVTDPSNNSPTQTPDGTQTPTQTPNGTQTVIDPSNNTPTQTPTQTPDGTQTPTQTPDGTQTPTQTPGGTQTPDSSSSGSSSSEESSESSDSSAPAVVTSAAGATVVVGSSRVTSSVGGIFTATAVTGTAITTPITNLASAIGLSSTELQAGTNVRSYVCNNQDPASRAALSNAAASVGKAVAGYVNMDLYTITKRGVVTKITTATEPVAIVLGLPGGLVNKGRTYSVLAIDPTGKPVVMDNVGTDPRSITINTKVFGAFSIVY